MPFAHSIAAIQEQIALQADIASVRVAILKLLHDSIEVRKDALQDRENEHFSNAITALTMNMQAPVQPSYSWLWLCLVDLEKAIASTALYDRDRHAPDADATNAKYENLMKAVAALERDLNNRLA